MFSFILEKVAGLFGEDSTFASSQRVLAYKQDVINLAGMNYEQGCTRIYQIMITMNQQDKDSFSNLIKFIAMEFRNSGYLLQATILLGFHSYALELSGR
jgi:hypothetical protein